MTSNKKNIGIWIDSNEALIVNELNGETTLSRMPSEMDHFNPHGGHGSSTPYGEQDAISETGLLNRKKQQAKRFFQRVIERVEKADQIVILGPAEMKGELKKEIEEHYKHLNQKLCDVLTKDSMTDNQVCAEVRDYFSDQAKQLDKTEPTT